MLFSWFTLGTRNNFCCNVIPWWRFGVTIEYKSRNKNLRKIHKLSPLQNESTISATETVTFLIHLASTSIYTGTCFPMRYSSKRMSHLKLRRLGTRICFDGSSKKFTKRKQVASSIPEVELSREGHLSTRLRRWIFRKMSQLPVKHETINRKKKEEIQLFILSYIKLNTSIMIGQ